MLLEAISPEAPDNLEEIAKEIYDKNVDAQEHLSSIPELCKNLNILAFQAENENVRLNATKHSLEIHGVGLQQRDSPTTKIAVVVNNGDESRLSQVLIGQRST